MAIKLDFAILGPPVLDNGLLLL